MLKVDEESIAFIAGIVECRGHIQLHPGRVRLRVTTRRQETLKWLADRTGVKVHVDDAGYLRKGCSEHCDAKHVHRVRQSAYWSVDGLRAGVILHASLPWLIEQRPPAVLALRMLALTWPTYPGRNEVGAQMRRLGWPLPMQSQMP